MTIGFLWAVLCASPLPAQAQGCYPPPCGTGASQSAPGAGAVAQQVVPVTQLAVTSDDDAPSSDPVVLAGLFIVATAFGAIAGHRRLAIVRRTDPAPARALPAPALGRREAERSFH